MVWGTAAGHHSALAALDFSAMSKRAQSDSSTDDLSLSAVEQERAELRGLASAPLGKRLAYYARKSGPGWLQGAITLGGGSLAGALYLGVIAGYHMMWLQPLAMVIGVIMLSAIAYVTLSTERRPFQAIKEHVSPVLGWAWLLAAGMANIVWCMPQFNLGRAAVQQNLLGQTDPGTLSTVVICLVLLVASFVVNLFYERGSGGIRIFEWVLKGMVGVVVLSFFGVVFALAASGKLNWEQVFAGAMPDFSLLTQPAPAFRETIAATGDYADFWTREIADRQRNIMMTAFGTAVGINMTFLLPYSMLRKRWGPEHRGLGIFDLSIGLIVPFVLATSCVVIAAASQFHAKTGDIFMEDGRTVRPAMAGTYSTVANKRLAAELGGDQFAAMSDPDKADARAALPEPDRQLAAMLANRDNLNLASALEPLTGRTVAQTIFGVGVLGMAWSTIIILMLISGFVFCEAAGKPGHRGIHLLGAAVSGIGGFFGPFIWGSADARAALAIPTSVIGGSMIPIAYFTFLLLMNSRSLLGPHLPSGGRRIVWNGLMIFATAIATAGSIWVLAGNKTPGYIGIGMLVALLGVGGVGFLQKERKAKTLDR
jgi:Mn2+/Fe2+ NRAMP family transporter